MNMLLLVGLSHVIMEKIRLKAMILSIVGIPIIIMLKTLTEQGVAGKKINIFMKMLVVPFL